MCNKFPAEVRRVLALLPHLPEVAMKRHVFAAAFGALLIVLPVRHALRADAALYTVEDLGQIDGLAPTVTGMNASGQVTGYVPNEFGLPRAVIFTNGQRLGVHPRRRHVL